ncbi:hypothetical protein [Actinoplanes sp. G11-F43]|uniref:hypothetical protein n=1 Tax=Actinoplanes sp. G11-F43 TaxID=3424130 RepID=UPI003D34DE37
MASANAWFRRRAPRLSGVLHVRDASGHEVTIPLRGRDALLTALRGYGAVWAVRTGDATSVMIVYGPTDAVADRRSGICPAGRTVVLGGAAFTWQAPGSAPRIPLPRTTPPNLRALPPRGTNSRAVPEPVGGLRRHLRNMVRVVTQRRTTG